MQKITVLWPDALLLLSLLLVWLNEIVSGTARPLGQRVAYTVAVLSPLISAAGYALLAAGGQSHYFFSNMLIVDPFANVMKAVVAAGFAISLIYSRQYLKARDLNRSDFYLLALFSLLGQLVMIGGHNFLTLYLGLELMSLSLYAMIALGRDKRSEAAPLEAAIKYYVLGALASGFLLYGISILYGATGSLDVGEVLRAIAYASHTGASGALDLQELLTTFALNASNRPVLLFGVVFIVAGVAFKLGAAPFHMWAPDVYQGASTAMTLLIGGASKVAVFAWGLRLLVTALWSFSLDWQQMLVIVAVLSLIIGNLTGIAQQNIKRMLAYSAIAQMGFVMLGLLSGVVIGQTVGLSAVSAYGSATFYSIVYFLTALGSFGVLLCLAQHGFEADRIDDLKGLNQRRPMLAFIMLVMMFSLAGIPPTAGFYAKFAVLEALLNAHLTWLAVLAVVTSLFSAFYYLRIVKLMYFDAPADLTDHAPIVAASTRALLAANGGLVLALGIMPGWLMSLCMRAISQIPL